MRFVGVDPGKLGGIAFLDAEGHVLELFATPMLSSVRQRRRGRVVVDVTTQVYDLATIAHIFRARADPRLPDRGMFVSVEQLDDLPAFRSRHKGEAPEAMGGGKANHARGQAILWPAMLAAFRIPYLLVRPQEWQRAMMLGFPGKDTKARSVAIARATWPAVSLLRTTLSRVEDDGLADALLMAEYGRRKHLGGAVFASAVRESAGGVRP